MAAKNNMHRLGEEILNHSIEGPDKLNSDD